MIRSQARLLHVAGRVAAIGGSIGTAAGVAQATVGYQMPNWSGNKAHPVALGLLTIALAATVLLAARTLSGRTVPDDETLSAFTLWLAAVAVVCSTTVGRLWAIPGALLLAASGVTLAACGWRHFRVVVATNWLRGLLGVLGALELLMAVSAGPTITVAAGLIAGVVLIAAAIMARPGRRPIMGVLAAATLPFAVLTWWTIVTPLLTVVAFVIGLAAAGRRVRCADAGTGAALDRQPVR